MGLASALGRLDDEPADRDRGGHAAAPKDRLPEDLPVRRASAVTQACDEEGDPPKQPKAAWTAEPRKSPDCLGLCGLDGFASKLLLPQVLERIEQVIERVGKRGLRRGCPSSGFAS